MANQSRALMEKKDRPVSLVIMLGFSLVLVLSLISAGILYYNTRGVSALAATVVAVFTLAPVGLAFLLVRRELVKRKQFEAVLSEAGDRYRSVVNHVAHGIIIIDEHGTIESVNPAAQKLFDYEPADLVGQNVRILLPEAYNGSHNSLIEYLRTEEEQENGISREALGRRRDGSTFPIELAVSTFAFGGRRLFTGIVQDITQRKHLEEELRLRADQLTDADRRKNEFLAMLSHELRNPLAPIRNALQLLRRKYPNEPTTDGIQDVIERQVQHMARMIDDLLDVSRITRGKITLQKAPIDIATAVSRAVEMVQPLIEARHHELTVSLPPGPLLLEADLPRLAQVLTNLLNNASKFTEEGGHVWLTVEQKGNEVLIAVRDTGTGIPADYLPRVFDLFSQQDISLERPHSGLGIGLTLARNLVTMHGGSIRANSAGVGQGSEFVVRLPVLTGKPPAQPAPLSGEARREAQEGSGSHRRILVVDDNIDGANTLTQLLKTAGHEVATAYDGLTALELARRWSPEVVLLDIGLPRLNGLEVARRLREGGRTSPYLIALTGYGQNEDRQRSQKAGFNAHLVKPLEMDVLQTLLQRAGVEHDRVLY